MNNFETTLQELQESRNLIDQAIVRLQHVIGISTRTVNRTTKTGTGKRHLTPAAKQKISEKMKAKWAARKAGKKLTVVSRKKAA